MSRPQTPDFDDLVGTDVQAAERDRLRAAHELLVQAGPPPELSPQLEQIPWPDEALAPLGLIRRKRADRGRPWVMYATAAAALVLVGFLVGQLGGSKSSTFDVAHTVKMHGTAKGSSAAAVIEVGRAGTDGNWPMLITVTNLSPSRSDSYYDLWLSKDGKPVYLCGSFNTKPGGTETVVRLSAAYPLKKGTLNGWVVTQHVDGMDDTKTPVVMTT
ncbi:MAG: hypothetical protein E6G32_05465 [Actinobacteria bacterium]|nr:MAG: hypothetical protein E6G32_05465 [Actinomycetota bacterium]